MFMGLGSAIVLGLYSVRVRYAGDGGRHGHNKFENVFGGAKARLQA